MVVGTVASTGHYDPRRSSERTYVGLDFDEGAPEKASEAEARILPDAFTGPFARLLERAGVGSGPSGAAVVLSTDP